MSDTEKDDSTTSFTSIGSDQPTIFTKVRPRRGFEFISDQIRDAVIAGQLKPGSRLPPEREMAEIFGISRQGVREALRGLEISGLVLSKPGVSGGVFIREGDPSVVIRAVHDMAALGALSSESLLEARILLTSDVIRLAGERADEHDLAALEEDIDSFERLDERGDLDGVDRSVRISNFYDVLAGASHNEVLLMLMKSLTNLLQLRLSRVGPKPLTNVSEMRRAFMRELRAGRTDEAVRLMTEHLKRVESRLSEKEDQIRQAGDRA